jgi:hypothetical protein
MLGNYFETVPVSLEEAAEIDGATRLTLARCTGVRTRPGGSRVARCLAMPARCTPVATDETG